MAIFKRATVEQRPFWSADWGEAPALIVQLREQGMPYHQIADVLTERGLKPPSGGKWWHSTVRMVYLKHGGSE